jgi:hypothetical protein
MSDKPCPNETDLVSYADTDLSPEQLERISLHLRTCKRCVRRVGKLEELIGDLAAPVFEQKLDLAKHVAGVMSRLDTPAKTARSSRFGALMGAFAAAATVALLLALKWPQDSTSSGEYAARGGPARASLARDVGVELYAQTQSTRPLASGARVGASTPLTAGVQNLGNEPAYLLLFGIDAKQNVHWITPEFTVIGSDPQATAVAPSRTERLLKSAAVFDDLALGRLRVVALITREPRRVSEVERLNPAALSKESLSKRFPSAEIREFFLEVSP